ncbi:flagellar hook-length control protein FliK [Brevundimonas sp.]|uniref:flagellar hook-length control protein FliK n=1 Tax=Brevundimonas sp. TaxID=1871086 RepID=UPI003567EA64
MSAQAVLSVIAPTISAPFKGASEAVDSGFESMLAEVVESDVGEDAAAPPEDKAALDAGQTNLFATPVPASHVPVTPPPVTPPPVTPPVLVNQSGEEAAPSAPAAPDARQPGNDNLPAPANGPDMSAIPNIRTSIAGDAATVTKAADRETTQTKAQATAAQAAIAQVATATPPHAAPALRPLAERTSEPVEVAAKDFDTSTEPRASVSNPASTPAGVQIDGGAKPAEPAIKAGVETTFPPLNDAEPEPEAQAPGDVATTQTQAPATTRDVTLSGLSRTTIDATAQIAAQILRKLEGRGTRFEMALHPEDLGRVDVRLDIDSRGRLSARLAFDNPAAATDLRGRADELRRQLEQAGFHLADDAFEFAERDSGSSAFDRGQNARHGQSRAFAAASRLNAEIDVAQPPRWLAIKLSPSGVDMKV